MKSATKKDKAPISNKETANNTIKENIVRPSIGIGEKNREEIVKILNGLLSDEFVMYAKLRKYHWNVVGMNFYSLHNLFEEQYKQVETFIDEIAERTRTIGGMAIGTLKEFTEHTRLRENPGEYPDAKAMLSDTVDSHEIIIRQMRQDLEECEEKYNDAGTSDFITALMEAHEKMAWMARAFLEENR
jgi:starvation-inducible DNA-binding protein